MTRIIVAALLALTLPAGAQVTGSLGPAAPALKRNVIVTDDIVRIGDLIDNAGTAADVPVFRAPDLGGTGAVPANRVLETARAHNVLGIDSGGISEVSVTHASRAITAKDIEERIVQVLAAQSGSAGTGRLAVRFEREPRTMHVEPTAMEPLQVVRLSHEPRTGYFDVTFELPGSTIARRLPLRFSGRVVETVETATLTRAVARGDIIRRSDLIIERRLKADAGSESFSDAEAVVGLSARRAMRAGQILRQADLMRQEMVQRNETVVLVFDAPGITLTMRGKALEAGAEGDIIPVLNVQSKRTVQGTVTGFGTVTVNAAKPRVATNFTASSAESGEASVSRAE